MTETTNKTGAIQYYSLHNVVSVKLSTQVLWNAVWRKLLAAWSIASGVEVAKFKLKRHCLSKTVLESKRSTPVSFYSKLNSSTQCNKQQWHLIKNYIIEMAYQRCSILSGPLCIALQWRYWKDRCLLHRGDRVYILLHGQVVTVAFSQKLENGRSSRLYRMKNISKPTSTCEIWISYYTPKIKRKSHGQKQIFTSSSKFFKFSFLNFRKFT